MSTLHCSKNCSRKKRSPEDSKLGPSAARQEHAPDLAPMHVHIWCRMKMLLIAS